MNRSDFQQLAELRIAEAEALLTFAAPMADGAYYIGGYAVECALKACISKLYAAEEWPDKKFVQDCHTHEILTLVKLAELETARSLDSANNPNLKTNWSVVKDWNENSRYERHSLLKAQRLYEAVTHPTDGVLPWLKTHW